MGSDLALARISLVLCSRRRRESLLERCRTSARMDQPANRRVYGLATVSRGSDVDATWCPGTLSQTDRSLIPFR